MYIVICSSPQQKNELIAKGFRKDVVIDWIDESGTLPEKNVDAIFDLCFNDINLKNNNYFEDVPVFVNAVNCTCESINKKNYTRINAWPGFLNRPLIEICGCDEVYRSKTETIFNALGWDFIWVKDDVGFISARIIAMIINEAYYALEDKVSTKEQVDIAMKLGTNYPYGPFEWSEKTGIRNIYNLLNNLYFHNKRYTVCNLLKQEAEKL